MSNNHRLTIIESPYAGETWRNTQYLKRCVLDSIARGEIPFASHGFYTNFLDDHMPDQRETGIQLGLRFWENAKNVTFYVDYGVSPGMLAALEHWFTFYSGGSLAVEFRRIGVNLEAEVAGQLDD